MATTHGRQAGLPVLDERITRMHGLDRLGAMAFVAALWIVMIFVLATIWPFIQSPTILAILVIAGSLVVTFNTAAIVALLRHYSEDKEFIYGIDLKHLDEMRRRRG